MTNQEVATQIVEDSKQYEIKGSEGEFLHGYLSGYEGAEDWSVIKKLNVLHEDFILYRALVRDLAREILIDGEKYNTSERKSPEERELSIEMYSNFFDKLKSIRHELDQTMFWCTMQN